MQNRSAFIERPSATSITLAKSTRIPVSTSAASSNTMDSTNREKNNDKITKMKFTKNPDSASPPTTSSSRRSPDRSPLTRSRVQPKRYAQLPSPIQRQQKPSFLNGNLTSTSAWNENKPFVPLPLYLPIPDRPEPLSKFSGSTGKSSKFISSPNRLSKKTLPARPDAGATNEGGRGFKLKDLLLLKGTPFLRRKRQSKGNASGSKKIVGASGLPVGSKQKVGKSSTPAAAGSPSRDSITNSIASSKFFRSFGRVASIRQPKKEEPMEERAASKMSMDEVSSIKVAERRNIAVRSTNLQEFSKRPSRIPVSTLFPRPSLTRKQDINIASTTSRLSTVIASPAKRQWDSSQSTSAADIRPRSSTSKSRKTNQRDSNFLLPPTASYTAGSRRRSESNSSDQNISPLPPLPSQVPSPVKSLGRRRIALGPEDNGIEGIRGGRRETLGATTDLANLIELLHGGSSEKIGSSAHSDDGSYVFSESGFPMDFVNDRETHSSSENNPSSSSIGSRNYQAITGTFSISNASTHSIESREDTGDIPGDLLMLMRSVEEGISSSREEQEHLAAPISASPTASSFEGRYSTAAMAIRSMLHAPSSFGRRVENPASPPSPETGRGGGGGWLSDSPGSMGGRDYGRRDNLEGDKMLDSIARDVILASIVGDSPSPPSSTPQEVTLSSIGQLSSPEQPIVSPPATDSSQFSSSSFISSPCPAAIPRPVNLPRAGARHSLVRYSQDSNRIRAGSRLTGNYSDSMGSSCAIESTSESEDEMLSEPTGWKKEDDHTSSTIFSLSSTNGSPCPLPTDRHVKMIGARVKDSKGAAGDTLGMRSSRSRKVAKAGKSLFNLPNTSAVGAWTQSMLVESTGTDTRPRSYLAERNSTIIIPLDTPPPSSPSTTSLSSAASNRSSAQTEPLHINSTRFGRTLSQRLSFIVSDPTEERRDEPANLLDQVIPEEQSFEEEATDSFARDSLSIRSRWSNDMIDEAESIRVISAIDMEEESDIPERHFSFGEDLDFIFGGAGMGLKVPTDSPDRQARLEELGRFRYQVSQEIKSSQVDWPSTEFSRDFVAGFNFPRGAMEILDFIFDSQRRFRSRFATSTSQPTPISRSSFLLPPNFPDVPVDVSPSPTPVPSPFVRPILGSKSSNVKHPVFAQLQPKPLEPSPFTALPPKLSTKFKNLRAKSSNLKALTVDSPSPKTKSVDVEFLGGIGGVSKRRMEQFDAARMKLEGNVTPIDRREESVDEDERDLVGKGTGHSGSTFARTPKFATKNRGQRRAGISSLR